MLETDSERGTSPGKRSQRARRTRVDVVQRRVAAKGIRLQIRSELQWVLKGIHEGIDRSARQIGAECGSVSIIVGAIVDVPGPRVIDFRGPVRRQVRHQAAGDTLRDAVGDFRRRQGDGERHQDILLEWIVRRSGWNEPSIELIAGRGNRAGIVTERREINEHTDGGGQVAVDGDHQGLYRRRGDERSALTTEVGGSRPRI